MATRVDLNLPPRLLEAARATQAANRRQLQNRERQVRDAREIKRRLRKIEEEERRATKQRDLWKGAVPEFDSSRSQPFQRRQLDLPQRSELATCFMQEIAYESLGPSGILDRSYPSKTVSKIWSYDQQATATYDPGFSEEYYDDVPRFSVLVYQIYKPLPISAGSFVLWCQKRIAGPTVPIGKEVVSNQCFLVTQRSVRKIGTPDSMNQLAIGGFDIEADGINTNSGCSGTPRSIQRFLGVELSVPPRYLKLNQQITRNDAGQVVDIARTMTGTVHRQSDYLDAGKPAAWLNKKARVDNEEIVTDKSSNYQGTIDPAENPMFGSFPVIAWDWGKPALCRQLLLQLGFTPADLVP